jgi:hypothetical protein
MIQFVTRLIARPYKQKRRPSKQVAIVVPLSNHFHLTNEETISLRHLVHHLGNYDKYLIAPRGLSVEVKGFEVRRFSRKFFGSAPAHNHLVYAPLFYKAFADYRYIFFYHLDSLVFSDQLKEWCDTDVDYIGPPWIRCADTPWVTSPQVGNGGFTLLKVEAALKVIYNRYRQEPWSYWKDMFSRNGRRMDPTIRVLRFLSRYFPTARLVNAPLRDWEEMQNPSQYNRNNDIFWSNKAVQFLPEFKVATFEEGLRFGFEAAPRECFEMNGKRMPFGCHAWARYDREFWEPYLLAHGDELGAHDRPPESDRPL